MAEPAPGHPEIVRVVAPNPGPMTLEGTNTYLVGSGPVWVIDPGPADSRHLDAVRTAAGERGGIAGVLLTHAHLDHSEGAEELGAPLLWEAGERGDEAEALLAAARGGEVTPVDAGERRPEREAGPFRVVPTPGHASDHAAFVWERGEGGRVCFCGDLVLGTGSSIVPPLAGGGSLADYMLSLDRVEALGADLLAPGHGPWITDPPAKLASYREHRLERERALRGALDRGERSRAALVAEVWSDVPEQLRPAAGLALQAHLEKLAAEGVRVGATRD